MRHKMMRNGFTLIEVVIAIAILAVIGLASSSVLLQMTQADEASSAQREVMTELQFSFLLIERDVRQMVARPTRKLEGEERNIYVTNDGDIVDSDMGGLGFVRAGWQNPADLLPRAELQPVAYRVRENVLQRVHGPFVDDVSGEPSVQNLLTNVVDFQVVLDRNGESYERWSQPNQLPDLVRVTIEHETLGKLERVLLTSGARPVAPTTEESP